MNIHTGLFVVFHHASSPTIRINVTFRESHCARNQSIHFKLHMFICYLAANV